MTHAADEGDVLVEARQATASYGSAPVLTGVDLVVRAGQFTGIVGPSGAGKTTLLRLLSGQVEPVSGMVERRDGLRIGFVPQVETVDWAFPVTVAEVVGMARSAGWRRPRLTSQERRGIDDLLEQLGLAGLAGRHIRRLSGGQQQRVFVARALWTEPDLLLLDEPTAGVDVRTRHGVLHLLEELHHEGLSILLTTHDLNGLAAHLPRLVCVNGEVIAAGPVDRVLTSDVLEQTYGAPMEVLQHGGMPVVVDPPRRVEHGWPGERPAGAVPRPNAMPGGGT